jgi:hypothetical protein
MKLGLDIKEPFGFSDSHSEEFDPYDIFSKRVIGTKE